MFNRLDGCFDSPGEEPNETDYWVVAHESRDFFVTREAAESVLRHLEASTKPRMIRFRDVHGSEISVRSSMIEYVKECTFAQRAASRRFSKAREAEEKEDRPWDDC